MNNTKCIRYSNMHGDDGLLRMQTRPIAAVISSRYIPRVVRATFTRYVMYDQRLGETRKLKRKDAF